MEGLKVGLKVVGLRVGNLVGIRDGKKVGFLTGLAEGARDGATGTPEGA